jgi:ABC-type antimicrobial peptide transport system permease subunit
MIKHSLTVAFRNLRKYKSQSIVGILGLAVGFFCFALSVMWIHYEMSYDTFHEGADRLYLVQQEFSFLNNSSLSVVTPYPLAVYLKENFPEVEDACNMQAWPSKIILDGVTHKIFRACVDSTFMRFFKIEVLEGNLDFLIPDSKKAAITQEEAQKLFGDESPLGKTYFSYGEEFTICALVKGWSKHSNYPFDFLQPNTIGSEWSHSSWQTLIRLKTGVDATAFGKKIYEYKDEKINLKKMAITPLTLLHYNSPEISVKIKFEYVVLFAVAGLLVIICSLFNTLTLFVTRFRIREKELALRKVCGSSFGSLFALLSTEFLMMASGAFILGLCAIHPLLAPFRDISEVSTPVSGIYGELAVYSLAIILISLLVFLLLLFFFQKRKLNTSIRNSSKNLSRKISVVIQLIISIGFIFCTTVMMKQIHFLHHVDMGIDFRKTAVVNIYPMDDSKVLDEQLKQIPEITATFTGHPSLMPKHASMQSSIKDWDGKPAEAKNLDIENICISKEYTEFYGFRLLAGEGIEEHHTNDEVWLNETAVKALGWRTEEAAGKHVKLERKEKTVLVLGVFKDIAVNSPVLPVNPIIFAKNFDGLSGSDNTVLLRYQAGSWKACKKQIEELAKKEYPNSNLNLENAEEEYESYLKSEKLLTKLLIIISLVCILISIFGLFSLVSLSCEQRQKEMAIRKINGATVKDILNLFFGEYMLLLVIGAVVAFPVGYFVMKKWVERYILQTEISAWIYLAIFLALGGIIVLCIGWRVYRASVENPAEVLKTE